jgi:hypothetical protein
MKKNKRSLVKRYGPDAEKVMYGRATNIAKKVAETQMEKTNLKELVRAALMQEKKFPDLTGDGKITYADVLKGRGVDIKEGPEDRDWATYVKSLVNDIRINGIGDYTTFSEDDFIADYEEYIGGKMDIDEDLDLGHQDDEPHMLKGDLYRIGKYAMELYQMVDQFEGMGEVDFPHWWQSKIIKAKEMISSAKHYLDFETKEPEIDAMVGAIDMSGALDNVGVEDEIEEVVGVALNGNDRKILLNALELAIKKVLPERSFETRNAQIPEEKLEQIVTDAKASALEQGLSVYIASQISSALKDSIFYGEIKTIPQMMQAINKFANENVKEGLPKDYWAKKIPGGKMDESYKALVKKIKGQGKSEKAAKAIAGAVASYKAKGGGKGPTAKQKARG